MAEQRRPDGGMTDRVREEINERYSTPPPDTEADEQSGEKKKSLGTDDKKAEGERLTAASGSSFTGATPSARDASAGLSPHLRLLDAGRGQRGYTPQANPPKGEKRR